MRCVPRAAGGGAPAGGGQFAALGSGRAPAPVRREEKEPDGRVQALAAAAILGPPAPPRECACLPLAALRQCGGGRSRGCRPAPSPRPCPGHSAPASARAPQPRAPQPRSPAPAAASSMGNLLGGVSFREPTTVEDCDSTWQTDSEPEPEELGPGGGAEGPGQEPAEPPERAGGRPRASPAADEKAEAAGAEQVCGPAVASGWAEVPLPPGAGRKDVAGAVSKRRASPARRARAPARGSNLRGCTLPCPGDPVAPRTGPGGGPERRGCPVPA